MMDSLLVAISEGVMTLTLNRPDKRNAIDAAVLDGLEKALRVARDEPIRVVVLQGAGGYFSAGIDLSYAMNPGEGWLSFMRRVGEVVVALHRTPVPTVSVVEGGAFGLGCNLALACDLTLAADDAVFCEVFTKLGLSLDGGGGWLLPRLVGLKRAKELAFFADVISAPEAEQLGLVNAALPVDQLSARVGDWTARLAAGPPIALSLTKAMLNDAYELSFEGAVEQESRCQSINTASGEMGARMGKALQKKK
jgi:2-(1,2-epoxy-1,2-dihydrophenyl)acetyl-CoA isomerase